MKVYPKQLNSLADLKKEQAKLTKQSNELDEADFFSLSNLFGKESTPTAEAEEDSTENNLLANAIPMLLPMAAPLMGWLGNAFSSMGGGDITSKIKNSTKKVLITTGKEVIGGYLKWKAIELSVKCIRYYINKKRAKK